MSINRKELVDRHRPVLTEPDAYSPLSVGNGQLAYTADISGFQSSTGIEPGEIPLCTMSQWGFHSYPIDQNSSASHKALRLKEYSNGKLSIGYMTDSEGQEQLFNYLRENPHRMNLGRFHLLVRDDKDAQYRELQLSELQETMQTLDLWTGLLKSRFLWNGIVVESTVACHPEADILAFQVKSALFSSGQMALALSFPYPSHFIEASNWELGNRHKSLLRKSEMAGNSDFIIERSIDDTDFFVSVMLSSGSEDSVHLKTEQEHRFLFESAKDGLELSFGFHQKTDDTSTHCLEPEECLTAAKNYWQLFWTQSAAMQLADSRHSKALELERRIILSRYLTAIQCSGSLPPQESGLTCNSWYGKFHLEMHPLHAAHFPLWGNGNMLARGLEYYKSISEKARDIARSQGYEGIRWPKMTDPTGNDSPSPIGPLLCWQQPHIIYFCELLRVTDPHSTVVDEYADLIFETANFMADYAVYDQSLDRYCLGPSLIPVQENHPPESCLNPVFELEYWRWALETAERWKVLLNQDVPEKWKKVRANLAVPVADQKEQVYLLHEACEDGYNNFAIDHPSVLMAMGLMPGASADATIMNRTFDKVLESWDFSTTWGWDFPMLAMTAARLGRHKEMFDVLLMEEEKNTYRASGHNAQLPKVQLPLYLPGNGALLLALPLMLLGSGSGETGQDSVFVHGDWYIEIEGLRSYPF